MIFHVEFYNRITGTLEHNDSYSSIEKAFADAHGRLVIVAWTEGVDISMAEEMKEPKHEVE